MSYISDQCENGEHYQCDDPIGCACPCHDEENYNDND